MKYSKYHALGNDYIVIDPVALKTQLTPADIKAVCDRHYGVGADGILLGPLESDDCDFALRIFNPDSSEAEKSGNGLRIFARYLWDQSRVAGNEFTVQTKGGVVSATVGEKGLSVTIGMGRVEFNRAPDGELQPEILKIKDREFACYVVNTGNPHCVIVVDDIDKAVAKEYGSLIESHPRFPGRTNIQFVRIIDRASIQIEIWERGAGYTLASGSSSTAAAAVSCALGFCDSSIEVCMPGGVINIEIDKEFYATMTGAVRKICDGEIHREVFGERSGY